MILAVRDVGKGEQARRTLPEPGTSSVVELDLADLDSVASGAKALAAEHSSVSALVCNAARTAPDPYSPPPASLAQPTEGDLMRKTLALLALTASLTGGTTLLATQASAAPVQAAPPVAQTTEDDGGDSDKTGLLGLLGLLGLAGLAKKKEHTDTARY